ncbi:SLC13 family permease, partial [Escherichia coli]|uniref:SLC13 family permease n=1 Tax=Escherichia coli TaxID=562 RepID=UPI003144E46A
LGDSSVLGIVTWEDVVKNKGGWNTLIWYGGIIGLSSLLSKVKFFEWLAEVFKNNLAFDGHGNVAFFVIIFLSIIVRYFFASGSAYIVAMLPVFAMLANVSGAPLMLTALALLFSNSYGGMVTHYGGAAGPVIFGVGYNDINLPGAYHPRRVVVEYADRLEHAVNILVILQVACAASAFAHPSHLLM